MKKAVIFDMDGVLVDSQPLHFTGDRLLLKYCGVEVTEDDMVKYAGTSNPNRFKKFIEIYHLKNTVEEMDRVRDNIMQKLVDESDLKAISGFRPLLKDLKEHHFLVALASSSSYAFIHSILDKTGIKDYFDYILSGEDLVNSKPAPDIFLKAAEELDCAPETCIVVEDSNNGVTAAVAANMKCIGYVNTTSGDQDLSEATVVIDNFNHIDASFIASL